MKTTYQNLCVLLLLCTSAAMAGDYGHDIAQELNNTDRVQIEAAINKHWPKAEFAALQNIVPRDYYQIESIKLITSKPELFAVVEFEERLVSESLSQVLTVTCRMRVEWQCGSPLANQYLHWHGQAQRIYLNVNVDENVATDAFAYVATIDSVESENGESLLADGEVPVIKDISRTGRGDFLVTVTNSDGSRTGRVFIKPAFDAQSSRSFSTVDGKSYRNTIGPDSNTDQ